MSNNRTLLANYIQGVNAPRNYIRNPGAEKNDQHVTDASNIHSRTTTTVLFGEGSHLIDATASGQNVDFLADNLDLGLLGQNCEARFVLRGDASLYTAVVRINGADVISPMTLQNTGTDSRPVSMFFPCGTSGVSPVVRITSTSASAAEIRVDDVYLGAAVSLGDAAIVTPWVSYTPTITHQTGGATNYTASGKWRRIGDSVEIQGRMTFSSSSAAFSDVRIGLPTGLVVDQSKMSFSGPDPASSIGTGSILDSGIATYGGLVLYRAGSDIIQIRVSSTTIHSGTAPSQMVNISESYPIASLSNNDEISWNFLVPIIGWSSSQAIRSEDSGLTPWVNYTPTITHDTGSMTNATTTAAWRRVGDTAEIKLKIAFSGASSAFTGIFFTTPSGIVIDTTKNLTSNGFLQGYVSIFDSGSGWYMGRVRNTSTTQFRLTNGSTNTSDAGSSSDPLQSMNIDNGAPITFASGDEIVAFVSVPVVGWNYTLPAPILVGSVTSNSVGAERIERATINAASGSCTIPSQSGSWITNSVANAQGDCTITITGFSASPTCTATVFVDDVPLHTVKIRAVSQTSVRFQGTYQNGATTVTTPSGHVFHVICMGPR
jgi:hypothetical protein